MLLLGCWYIFTTPVIVLFWQSQSFTQGHTTASLQININVIVRSLFFHFTVKVNDTVIFGGDGDEDEIQFDDIDDDGEEEADIDAV